MSEQEWQSQFYWFMSNLLLVKGNSKGHNLNFVLTDYKTLKIQLSRYDKFNLNL